jgi:hypothetical protein
LVLKWHYFLFITRELNKIEKQCFLAKGLVQLNPVSGTALRQLLKGKKWLQVTLSGLCLEPADLLIISNCMPKCNGFDDFKFTSGTNDNARCRNTGPTLTTNPDP